MDVVLQRIKECIEDKSFILHISSLGLKELPKNFPDSLHAFKA